MSFPNIILLFISFSDLQQINEVIQSGNDCVSNGTKWSQCSVSCGVGMSVRMAPKHCRKKDDTRLCYIRPCGKVLYSNSVSEWKCCPSFAHFTLFVCSRVFKATFNNISVISWGSVLFV